MAMKYAPAIAAAVGVLIAATAASAAKKHPRYVRPSVAPVVVAPAPSWRYGAARPYGCVQDEGYGRYTVCGQGPP
jgi:hypothetical protein